MGEDGAAELRMTPPSPLFIPSQSLFVWYAWYRDNLETDHRWHRTNWEASSREDATKLRGSPMYHTEFTDEMPQLLVEESRTFQPLLPCVLTPDGSSCDWVDGVPSTFHRLGVSFGTRLHWRQGRIAWVLAFKDENTVVVRSFKRAVPVADRTTTDEEASLSEFEAVLIQPAD